MTDERKWRDAKIPQWVKDAVELEIARVALHGALSWPTEPRPTPLPFSWGDYDNLRGTPVAGAFFHALLGYAGRVHIRPNEGKSSWKKWEFSTDGVRWSDSVQRGPLFAAERDARLYLLWDKCEAAAGNLLEARAGL